MALQSVGGLLGDIWTSNPVTFVQANAKHVQSFPNQENIHHICILTFVVLTLQAHSPGPNAVPLQSLVKDLCIMP